LAIHDEPEHAVPNLPWVTALLDQVKQDGAGILMTGQMGNASLSWPGDSRRTLDLIATGDVPGVLRTLRHARAAGRGGWRGAIWRGIVHPLKTLVAAERTRRDPTRQQGFQMSVIAPRFAERMGLIEHVRASGWDPLLARASARERRLSYLLPGRLPINAWWHQRIAAHGLDVRDPTVDVRLLEFCVGTPDEQFAREGHDRWLARRALAPLIPSEVAWSRRRGAQGADIAYRLRADAAAVSDAVRRLAETELVREYLDVGLIERNWQQVRVGGSEGALELSRGLLFGAFLLRDREEV
jgi:asparagine synthase (glutamine-hydrolysing)